MDELGPSLGEQAARPGRADVVVGKDILELVSTAMYVDPLSVYREYIQNAADAIDEAVALRLLATPAEGHIEIEIDLDERRIRIRDNGTGVPPQHFARWMVALGGSYKRGKAFRGFRGVGRLAGLGCAQELVFRSRAPGQADVSEIRWDCRRLKRALDDQAFSDDVTALVADVVSLSRIPAKGFPERFFEVELLKVVRQRNDKLMDANEVGEYLSQVAPLPFAADFPRGDAIAQRLREVSALSEFTICINDRAPLTRPYGASINLGQGKWSALGELAIVEIAGIDGRLAALGWFVHHDYTGALPNAALVKGIRLRAGNLQVGDHALLDVIFPEPRFNSWAIGEVHVLDARIVPNGRRDNFEQNAHFTNLVNQLVPIGREIANLCRTNSARRSKLRQFDFAAAECSQHAGALLGTHHTKAARRKTIEVAEAALARMEHLADQGALAEERPRLMTSIKKARNELAEALAVNQTRGALDHFPSRERAAYERVFELIFQYLPASSAKNLVEKLGSGLSQHREARNSGSIGRPERARAKDSMTGKVAK